MFFLIRMQLNRRKLSITVTGNLKKSIEFKKLHRNAEIADSHGFSITPAVFEKQGALTLRHRMSAPVLFICIFPILRCSRPIVRRN